MEYEDHIVLATKVPEGSPVDHYANKFYKWFRETNTVEFIPFQKEVYTASDFGQIVNKASSDIDGRFTIQNQENILYFAGEYADTQRTTLPSESSDEIARINNLSAIFTYDGKVIGRSGCPQTVKDTIDVSGSIGTIANNEYVRLLPFKIDYKGRHTFGNYSQHLFVNEEGAIPDYRLIKKNILPDDSGFDTIVGLKLADGTCNLNSTDSALGRTVNMANVTPRTGYDSVGKGAVLYGIAHDYAYTLLGDPPGSSGAKSLETYKFYRCVVEDIDHVAQTAVLGEFYTYSQDSGLWEESDKFIHSMVTRFGDQGSPFLSNVITAVYGSDQGLTGYVLRGFTNLVYNGDNAVDAITVYYGTEKNYSGVTPYGHEFDKENSDIFLYIPNSFDDAVDPTTVKSPPPKVRHFTDYVGAFVLVDHEKLYFSDFSVGGNIETFTGGDNFPFGSSKRGPITGVFANETFLVGFREQEAYYITGNIFTANFRIQAYRSTRIGCIDPKSIEEFEGAGVFASERGIFVASQGGTMVELSDILEPIFTDNALSLDLNINNVQTLVDFRREYMYFVIESTGSQEAFTLAYSYYHKEWYLYDAINIDGGVRLIDGKLMSSDGTNISIEGTTNTSLEAFYRSNFETLGFPSFAKKFLQILLYTMDFTQASSIGINTYRDWNTEDTSTEESEDIDVGQVDCNQRLNPARSQSMAFEMVSDSGNELIVNGYEYEVEADVEMFKDDDN